MSATTNSKEEIKETPLRKISISRRKSSRSLEIRDHIFIKNKEKRNQLANNDKELIEETKQTEENEFETLKQQNDTLQHTINNAKIMLLDQNTTDATNLSLEHLLQKQKETIQKLMTQNHEMKTELQKNKNLYSEKVIYLTQKNEYVIKNCDHKMKQVLIQKEKITSELNENSTFTLLLKQQHYSEMQELQQKLKSTEGKYKLAVESEASYRTKMDEIQSEIEQLQLGTNDAENVGYFNMKHLRAISYSDLSVSENRKLISNDHYDMIHILRQYYMTRMIVFGIGMWILPSNMVGSVLLGTANSFNWIRSYKYGTKSDLVTQSIVWSAQLFASKYLKDVKHIGVGIACHGLSDLLYVYQLYLNKENGMYNPMSSIIKEIGMSAMLNVVMGVGILLLSKNTT